MRQVETDQIEHRKKLISGTVRAILCPIWTMTSSLNNRTAVVIISTHISAKTQRRKFGYEGIRKYLNHANCLKNNVNALTAFDVPYQAIFIAGLGSLPQQQADAETSEQKQELNRERHTKAFEDIATRQELIRCQGHWCFTQNKTDKNTKAIREREDCNEAVSELPAVKSSVFTNVSALPRAF